MRDFGLVNTICFMLLRDTTISTVVVGDLVSGMYRREASQLWRRTTDTNANTFPKSTGKSKVSGDQVDGATSQSHGRWRSEI